MNRNILVSVALLAVCFIIVLVLFYVGNFGFQRSPVQADWGTFGDYFGGVLNPIFGMCAFLGVLWSLDIQLKQLKQISLDKNGDELLVVIKDIDARIGEILNVEVGKVDNEVLFFHHMVAEAERNAGVLGSADSYTQFITATNNKGSILEASARELKNKVVVLHSFLIRYPQGQMGVNAPIVEYYVDKTSRVVKMLCDIGDVPAVVSDYFLKDKSN